MESIPLNILIVILIACIGISFIFSGAETALMTLNPYRLRYLSKFKTSAKLAQKLLKRPDRILALILLGNNFANIFASAITTVIAVKLDIGILPLSFGLTAIILIFAEVAPKTIGALYSEKVSFALVYLLRVLLWVFYPFVWLINAFSNNLLKMIGVSSIKKNAHHLSPEELRILVLETAGRIPIQHRDMLLGILDLENVSINEIMVPRMDVIGIDLENSDATILNQLASTQHTFMPVYRGDLDNILGILHTRDALNLLADENFSRDNLEAALTTPYFVPEGTSLTKQLIQFRENQRRLGLVVNEYGDIQGLITLEDILEEVVGEFTTDMATIRKDIHPQGDDTYLVDGGLTIRELNRAMGLTLPTTGPKTLSGLIIDYLENIPEIGTCCLIQNIPLEVVQIAENRIKTVRLSRPIERD